MIIPNEEWSLALAKAREWVVDPTVEVVYAGPNGVVMRRGNIEFGLCFAPRMISFSEVQHDY